MSTFKDFRFRVEVDRHSTRRLTLTAAGKPPMAVATPPEFRGGLPNLWSPEDLLVASAATCYALTFEAVAERRELPLRGLDVTGVGHISRRADGRWLDAMGPIEPIKWIGRADAPILFLSGRNDELVPPADARTYQQAAHQPKDVRWYDSGHILPPQSLCDASHWLQQRIAIAADKHPACG